MLDDGTDLFGMDWCLDAALKGVGLIGELPLTESDLDLMTKRLRECLDTRGLGPGTAHLEDCGARVVACFLVHLGVRKYQEGDFWGAVAKALGRDLGSNLLTRWGKIVEQLLKDYGLSPFQDSDEPVGHRYVTPILGHGGIPDYCLNDFFDKLLMPVVRGRLDYDGDVGHLLDRWQARSSDYQTADKPIRRFLEHGGKVARDFLTRSLDMAEAFDTGSFDGTDRFGLPNRVVERFRVWSADHAPSRRARGRRDIGATLPAA